MTSVLLRFGTALLVVLGAGLVPPAGRVVFAQPAEEQSISRSRLATELGARIQKVEEFRFIKNRAQRLGVRVWLGGGLATSYGHYVRRDLLREANSTNNGSLVFDYDLTSLTTLSQDLDIVIDGTAEQAIELERAVAKEFPYQQGSQSAWEIRPLRSSRPPKEALLNNPNFINQHTDSTSTGLIEITDPPKGESRVRDLLSFTSADSVFLGDLAAGKIRYYHSAKHGETQLAREERNPEIFSVVRYLIKLSRHDLEPLPDDLKLLEQAVSRFDPDKDLKHPYVRDWIGKNIKKLVQDSTDLEQLWSLLDQLGLRKKLQQVGNPQEVGSVAWWANKQPLLSSPIKKGPTEKMAGELGITLVAHETRDYETYESIRRSLDGRPNAFISRKEGSVGELAVNGDGFYARTGSLGGASGGYTVRFEVLPDAVEGVDFFVVGKTLGKVGEGTDIIIKNRNAIRVVQEPEIVGFQQYFTLLLEGGQNDGLLSRFKRKLLSQKVQVTPEERQWAWGLAQGHQKAMACLFELDPEFGAAVVEKEISKPRPDIKVLRAWFSLEASRKWPKFMDQLMEKKTGSAIESCSWKNIAQLWQRELTRLVLKPEILNAVLFNVSETVTINREQFAFDRAFWRSLLPVEETLKQLDLLLNAKETSREIKLKNEGAAFQLRYRLAQYLLSIDWSNAQIANEAAPVVERLVSFGDYEVSRAVDRALTNSFWSRHPKGGEFLMKRIEFARNENWDLDETGLTERRNRLIFEIFSQPHWRQHPRWSAILHEYLFDREAETVVRFVLAKFDPAQKPVLFDLLDAILAKGSFHGQIAQFVFSQPQWREPSVLPKTLKVLDRILVVKKGAVPEIMTYVLPYLDPADPRVVGIFEKCIMAELKFVAPAFFRDLLPVARWWEVPRVRQLTQGLLNDPEFRRTFLQEALPKMAKHPEGPSFYKYFLSQARTAEDFDLLIYALIGKDWADTPEGLAFLEGFIRRDVYPESLRRVLGFSHWENHIKLRELCKGQKPTPWLLREALLSGRSLQNNVSPCGIVLAEQLKMLLR